jgi:hypothetical protein
MSKIRPVAALVIVGVLCQSFFLQLQFRDSVVGDESSSRPQQIYYKKSSGNFALSNPNLHQQTWDSNELFDPIDRPMAARDIFTMTPLEVCGRMAAIPPEQEQQSIHKYTRECPSTVAFDDPIFLIEGHDPFGRTGNKLLGFLHALEKARKTGRIVGVVMDSWALPVITTFFMSIQDGDVDEWKEQVEKTFCIKLITHEELPNYTDVVRKDAKDIFIYTGDSDEDLEEYIEFQTFHIRNLFRHYNTGEGVSSQNKKVRDMCVSLDEIFGNDKRSQVYSVIHSRSFNSRPLERKSGMDQLGRISSKSGCDPVAALDMQPEYVKSIVRPLGMLNHPIILISDGQDLSVAERLQADPEIGPMLRTVPNRAKWVGGDITLAIMSTVFVGNPASTFSGFIAKSRIALGLDKTFMFRARDGKGEWVNTCEEKCIFSKRIMKSMA